MESQSKQNTKIAHTSLSFKLLTYQKFSFNREYLYEMYELQ